MDASCGPSNGVKSLQRHFEQDRSVHQSHLHSANANQQFRTSHTQSQLEFANREQGDFLNGGRSEPFMPGPMQGRQDHRWAQEFRETDPRPHLFQAATKQQAPALDGWGHEFMALQQTHVMSSQSPGPGPYYSTGRQIWPDVSRPLEHLTLTRHAPPTDEAAFSRAFEEAEASLQTFNLDVQPDAHVPRFQHHDVDNHEPHIRSGETELRDLDVRESLDDMDERMEGDALAQTAQELIHTLRHEQSPKFQKSQFMALMHKLKEKEVVVTDNKLMDVSTGTEIKTHSSVPFVSLDEHDPVCFID